MKKLFLLSLLACLPLQVFAESSCVLKYQIIKDIYSPANANFRCEFVQSLDSEFYSINQLFHKNDQKDLYLLLYPTGNNASFDLGHFLELPERIVQYDKFGNQLSTSILGLNAIAHHEYGHFIFQQLLKEKFGTIFDSLFNTFDTYSEKKRQKLIHHKTVLNKDENNEYLEALKKEPELKRFNKVISIYTELYADVISVYFNSNKNSIFESLYYNQMSDFEYNLVRLRSFDLETSENDLNNMATEHNYLSITRAYIGKNLWPTNDHEKLKYLEIIERAFIKSIEIDLQRGEILDIVEANEQLIDLLKEEN